VNRDSPVTLSEVISVQNRNVRFRGGDSSNPSTGYLGTPINIDILNDQYIAQNNAPVIRQTFTPIGNWGGSYSLWLGRVFGGGTLVGSLKAITSRVYDDPTNTGTGDPAWKQNSHTSFNVMSDYASSQSVVYVGSGNFSGNTRLSLYTEQGAILGASAGSVGIGTTSPLSTVKLDVNGLVRSNVTVQQITDAKHLTTKEYVDNRQAMVVYDVERQVVGLVSSAATPTTRQLLSFPQNTTGIPANARYVILNVLSKHDGNTVFVISMGISATVNTGHRIIYQSASGGGDSVAWASQFILPVTSVSGIPSVYWNSNVNAGNSSTQTTFCVAGYIL
jgi:hypothetical protein